MGYLKNYDVFYDDVICSVLTAIIVLYYSDILRSAAASFYFIVLYYSDILWSATAAFYFIVLYYSDILRSTAAAFYFIVLYYSDILFYFILRSAALYFAKKEEKVIKIVICSQS